jgi:glutathione peroxidase
MKIIIITILLATAAVFYAFKKHQSNVRMRLAESTPSDVYAISYISIDGKTVNLSDYKGKYLLVVNVASKCGYTPQYEKLEELYKTYGDKLVIVGFPCNQFLSQEPGSEKEIAEFCTKNYGVTFPLASKISVKGDQQHPLYTWLTTKTLNQVEDAEVKWNFHKFLIGPDGKYLGSFGSKVDPLDAAITGLIK